MWTEAAKMSASAAAEQLSEHLRQHGRRRRSALKRFALSQLLRISSSGLLLTIYSET